MPMYITLALPSLDTPPLLTRPTPKSYSQTGPRLSVLSTFSPSHRDYSTSSRLSEPWATPLFPAYPPSPSFTSFPHPRGDHLNFILTSTWAPWPLSVWPPTLPQSDHLSASPPFQEDDHSWSKGHSGRNRCQPTARRAQFSSGLRAFLWLSPVLHQLPLFVILQLFPSSYASEYLCFLTDKLGVIISTLQVAVKNDRYAHKWPGTLQIIHMHSSFIATFLAPNTICISLTLNKPSYLMEKREGMKYGEDGDLYRPESTNLTDTHLH